MNIVYEDHADDEILLEDDLFINTALLIMKPVDLSLSFSIQIRDKIKKPNYPACDFNDVTLGSSAVFKMEIDFLSQDQRQLLRPVAFRPHLTMGSALQERN